MRKIFPPKDLEKYGALKYACAGFFKNIIYIVKKIDIYSLVVFLYFMIIKSMK